MSMLQRARWKGSSSGHQRTGRTGERLSVKCPLFPGTPVRAYVQRGAVMKELRDLEKSALEEIGAASESQDLETLRIRYLGKKGAVTAFLRSVGKLPEDERPAAGEAANEVKGRIREVLAARQKEMEGGSRAPAGLDVTLPGRSPSVGRRHPLVLVTEEIISIFGDLGFQVAEGPEIETEYYNFEALNTPPDHPARDEQDSFYLDRRKGLLLRTQTSPVQIRVMEGQRPPVRVIAPGRCFRRDTTDASHHPVFHQVEGLLVDRGVSFADLKGALEVFSREMFGPATRTRFRPDFFPFTEPSADMSISCFLCSGEGCRVCSRTGWLEILGSGMVDPNVFRAVGYDPEEVTGFAFGMGVERIAMLKYGIDDIRALYENDVRLLRQF